MVKCDLSIWIMLIEHFEHIDHNGALGMHKACDERTNLQRKKRIIKKRNGSSEKGTNLLKAGLEQLRVV